MQNRLFFLVGMLRPDRLPAERLDTCLRSRGGGLGLDLVPHLAIKQRRRRELPDLTPRQRAPGAKPE